MLFEKDGPSGLIGSWQETTVIQCNRAVCFLGHKFRRRWAHALSNKVSPLHMGVSNKLPYITFGRHSAITTTWLLLLLLHAFPDTIMVSSALRGSLSREKANGERYIPSNYIINPSRPDLPQVLAVLGLITKQAKGSQLFYSDRCCLANLSWYQGLIPLILPNMFNTIDPTPTLPLTVLRTIIRLMDYLFT